MTFKEELISQYKKENDNLTNFLESTDWEDQKFGANLIEANLKSNPRTLELYERMFSTDIQIVEKTYELIKAHKACINDWYVEEIEGELQPNYSNVSNEDFMRLYDINSEINRLSNIQRTMVSDMMQEASDSLD